MIKKLNESDIIMQTIKVCKEDDGIQPEPIIQQYIEEIKEQERQRAITLLNERKKMFLKDKKKWSRELHELLILEDLITKY